LRKKGRSEEGCPTHPGTGVDDFIRIGTLTVGFRFLDIAKASIRRANVFLADPASSQGLAAPGAIVVVLAL
jgi:hypothetical protein